MMILIENSLFFTNNKAILCVTIIVRVLLGAIIRLWWRIIVDHNLSRFFKIFTFVKKMTHRSTMTHPGDPT